MVWIVSDLKVKFFIAFRCSNLRSLGLNKFLIGYKYYHWQVDKIFVYLILLEKHKNMDWIFDGIGTAIVTLIVGLISGGAVGYRIGINKKVKQTQKAGDNASQMQVGNDYNRR